MAKQVEKDVIEVKAKTASTKKKKEEKSRILEVLTKEYKYENLILGLLATVVALIACYLITGDLVFNSGWNFIQGREKTIGWALVLFAASIIIALLVPFFKPSFEEIDKVTFPDGKEMRLQSTRVFSFMIFFAIVFLILGVFFKYLLVEWLEVI